MRTEADRDSTIGQELAWLMRDRDVAWIALQQLTHRCIWRIARRWRLQMADVDDMAEEVLLRAVVDDFAALRRSAPDAPLGGWLTVTAKNALRERARSDAVIRSWLAEEKARAVRVRREPDPPPRRARRVHRLRLDDLTRAQSAVVALWLERESERAIAEKLGITRDRVHDLKRRAVRRLKRKAARKPPSDVTDRSWANALAARERERGDEATARVLDMYTGGATRAEIAAATGLTSTAVKERIHRRRPKA